MTSKRSVLVTGGAGFIGSHLVERLLQNGHAVTVLDNLSTGKLSNLPGHDALDFVHGDIASPESVDKALDGKDVVYHLAAVASVQASVEDPVTTHRSNLEGTIRVLEAAKRSCVERFVYASSAAVYGDAVSLPIDEKANKFPLSPYAIDKLAGEHYLAHYHRQGWLAGTAFRFFNVFGPRQDPSSPYSGVISVFARLAKEGQMVTIFGDGKQSRDFIFVGDLVHILVAALEWAREDELPALNVGRSEPVTLLELLATIENLRGKPVDRRLAPARPGDIRHSLANVSKLRERMPGVAFTSLEEGLAKTLREP